MPLQTVVFSLFTVGFACDFETSFTVQRAHSFALCWDVGSGIWGALSLDTSEQVQP